MAGVGKARMRHADIERDHHYRICDSLGGDHGRANNPIGSDNVGRLHAKSRPRPHLARKDNDKAGMKLWTKIKGQFMAAHDGISWWKQRNHLEIISRDKNR